MPADADRNFDDLLERFEKRVYGTFKGDWRLRLLKQDLAQFHAHKPPLRIWDAGCGLAQISLWLAQAGHQLSLCDLSVRMLERARDKFAAEQIKADFLHSSVQQAAPQLPAFDLVLFHAVLEWLADPLPTLAIVAGKIKPGGTLSLLFYNRNALVYSNVLKGQWRWKFILEDRYIGVGKKLTPPNPMFPHQVIDFLEHSGFTIQQQTGIRVFHDYIADDIRQSSDQDTLLALEERYCRQPGFRDMGRYVHLLARRD